MVDRLTLRGILFWIWFAVELNSLTERTRRNETTTSNTSIWLWIFLPSSSVLYAAQQTFGSASVTVGSAASEKQPQQQRVSRQNNKHNCVTSSTVPTAATSAATQAAVRCEQVEAEAEDDDASAAAAADATLRSAATPTRCLFALAHFRWQRRRSLSHWEQQRKRGIERGRAREFVWARSHKICLFWLSVRACKLCRAERRKAEQRSNCAARRLSLLGF